MTFSRRLMIVGGDHRFSQQLQNHLHQTFLITTPIVQYDDLDDLVSDVTDGVLIFVGGSSNAMERAIRTFRLRAFPMRMINVAEDAVSPTASLVDDHFVWPEQRRELNSWIRKYTTAGVGFHDPATETVRDILKRKVLTTTPSLEPLIEQLEIAAGHDVTVLIEGETGTGKTYIARLIHQSSARAGHRFLVIACGALSEQLIASEFFGHVRGAFTGAEIAKVGKFAAAGQGTILLDEIDTLGMEHQTNLLRVIESGEFEPVGGTETQKTQARVIAATNWNLANAVEEGKFREDLYYRLHVLTLQLPPLRSRSRDIAPLARWLTGKYAEKFGKAIESIHPNAIQLLEQCTWPGNIRQLENVIQQSVLSATGTTVEVNDLPVLMRGHAGALNGIDRQTQMPGMLAYNRENTERAMIVQTLDKVNQSRTQAAAILGVSRVTLYKKMKKYGLLRNDNIALTRRGKESLNVTTSNAPVETLNEQRHFALHLHSTGTFNPSRCRSTSFRSRSFCLTMRLARCFGRWSNRSFARGVSS